MSKHVDAQKMQRYSISYHVIYYENSTFSDFDRPAMPNLTIVL